MNKKLLIILFVMSFMVIPFFVSAVDFCITICDEQFCCDSEKDGICVEDPIYNPLNLECDTCDLDCDCGNNNGGKAVVTGAVYEDDGDNDIDNPPIPGAVVTLINEENTYTQTTDDEGFYSFAEVYVETDTTYTIIVSGIGYITQTEQIPLENNDDISRIYYLKKSNSDCKDDCTRKYNICDKSCQGLNGCWFYEQWPGDTTTRDACDLGDGLLDGHTSDHIVELADGRIVSCCEGTIRDKNPLIKADPIVENAESVIVTRRIVILNGKSVTMNVLVYD